MKIEIYTDGGARPNPGKGANAFCIVRNNVLLYHDVNYKEETTNNEMEITAMKNALISFNKLLDFPSYNLTSVNEVVIYTDSQYVKKGITEWIYGWLKRDWKTANKKDVKNKEVWKELLNISDIIRDKKIPISFEWVKAHNGNKYNEIVDDLCTREILKNN